MNTLHANVIYANANVILFVGVGGVPLKGGSSKQTNKQTNKRKLPKRLYL